jgi:DNA-binding HxlR family transcriptional regulator
MTVRSYHQYCGTARALDLVGERWSLLIVRDLLPGPQRYSDLLHTLAGIPTDVLASRLRSLEAAGIVRRATLPPPAGSKVYELTERGRGLEGVVVELSRWGTELLDEPADEDVFRAEWLALSLRSRFRPERAGGVDLTVAFAVDGTTIVAEIRDGSLVAHAGPAAVPETTPDVVVTGDPGALLAAARGEPTGDRVSVTGDPGAVAALAAVLGLPALPTRPARPTPEER